MKKKNIFENYLESALQQIFSSPTSWDYAISQAWRELESYYTNDKGTTTFTPSTSFLPVLQRIFALGYMRGVRDERERQRANDTARVGKTIAI